MIFEYIQATANKLAVSLSTPAQRPRRSRRSCTCGDSFVTVTNNYISLDYIRLAPARASPVDFLTWHKKKRRISCHFPVFMCKKMTTLSHLEYSYSSYRNIEQNNGKLKLPYFSFIRVVFKLFLMNFCMYVRN